MGLLMSRGSGLSFEAGRRRRSSYLAGGLFDGVLGFWFVMYPEEGGMLQIMFIFRLVYRGRKSKLPLSAYQQLLSLLHQ